jgi:cytochrome c oxidase cbb3-type subunit 4
MSSGTLSGIATGVLIILFIGLCVWAWSARRKAQFDRAARMPLEDDEGSAS